MGVKHAKHTFTSDGPDDGRVQPSWWNEDHDIGPFLDKIIGLAPTPSTFLYIKPNGDAANSPISEFARAAMASASASEFASSLGAAPLDSPGFTGSPRVPTVPGTSDSSNLAASTAFVQNVRALLATLNSPSFTGTPTAPTAALGTNSAQIATMAALMQMRADLVGSSPATLDTLNEIASALGNDPNLSTTLTNLIGLKVAKSANLSDLASISMAKANLGIPVSFIDSIATLRSNTSTGLTAIFVSSYYAGGKAGGGQFKYDASDTTSADNGGTVVVDAGGRRWKRVGSSGIVSVTDFGAKCDASTDDSAAFIAALNSSYGVTVTVPAGTTSVVKNVTFPSVCTLRGAGETPFATRLLANQANEPIFIFPHTKVDINVENFWLDRSVTATNGGFGLLCPGYNENCQLSNLYIVNQWMGLRLGVTGNSRAMRVDIAHCYSHGLAILPDTNVSGGIGGGQWQLHDVSAGGNEGDGLYVGADLTFTGSVTLGNWSNIRTFANHGMGINLQGKPGNGISDLVLCGFFGGDSGGGYEIRVDSYGGNNLFSNINIEQVGTAANGAGFAHPAPMVGSGVNVTANSYSTTFSNVVVNTSANHGFVNSGSNTVIAGASLNYGNQSGTGGYGLYHAAGTLTVTGLNATQNQYGLYVGADTIAASGMNLQGNTVGRIGTALPLVNSSISGVFPARAWTSYTPTVTAGGGAFGTLGAVTGEYFLVERTVYFRAEVPITTNGTAVGNVTIALPVAPKRNTSCGGIERGATGRGLNGLITANSTDCIVRFDDATYPGANGALLVINGEYETI